MAVAPNSWAGTEPKAPLNEPTGVRAAEAMTISLADIGKLRTIETAESETTDSRR
jgi:hypothetical protein